ncbi:MAG: porin family protein [Sphingomonadaceae bacterium]|nr:porin family protein [Sphingomonadaceae bacterium]
MKKILAALAVGTALSATPALAQDARATFTGPRIEATVGWDKSRSGSSVDNDTTRDLDQSVDGLVYGGGIGFDAAVGDNFVVGAEAELTDSTAKAVNDGVPNTFNLGRVETGRDIYVGARAGFVVGEKMLVYAKGGYTNARYNLVGTDGTVNLDQRLDTDGWRAGAGVEMALSKNAFVKAEYRYSKYSNAEFDFNGTTPDSSRFKIDTDRHQVVASVGLRF